MAEIDVQYGDEHIQFWEKTNFSRFQAKGSRQELLEGALTRDVAKFCFLLQAAETQNVIPKMTNSL